MFVIPRNSLYRGIRYIEVRYIEVLLHTFYDNFSRDVPGVSFVISRTSLNRGSLNRASTVVETLLILKPSKDTYYT